MGMRRELRVTLDLPVRIWGMDPTGKVFDQEAKTIDVTTTGVRLAGVTHPLNRGSVVGVQHRGSKARFRVTWVGQQGTMEEGQIGLQLIESGKFIWGRVIPRIFGDNFRLLDSEQP